MQMEEEETTYIEGLPTETELLVTAEILNKKKLIDFDCLTYNRVYTIKEVSQIVDQLEFDDEYLIHRLMLKCTSIHLFDGINPKLKKMIDDNPTYTYESTK